jgi:hypothetical protein
VTDFDNTRALPDAKHPKSARNVRLGDGLGPVIARIAAIATQSYNSLLLADGPPNPDYELLDLCSEAMHALKQAERAYDAWPGYDRPRTDEDRARDHAFLAEARTQTTIAKRLMRRAGTMKATTAAGIYAKALLVRSSVSGAAVLAHSLADDFIACDGLRASLWPSMDVGAVE